MAQRLKSPQSETRLAPRSRRTKVTLAVWGAAVVGTFSATGAGSDCFCGSGGGVAGQTVASAVSRGGFPAQSRRVPAVPAIDHRHRGFAQPRLVVVQCLRFARFVFSKHACRFAYGLPFLTASKDLFDIAFSFSFAVFRIGVRHHGAEAVKFKSKRWDSRRPQSLAKDAIGS